MRALFFLIFTLFCASVLEAQNLPGGFPSTITPQMRELAKKIMPPGSMLPGNDKEGNKEDKEKKASGKPLIEIPPVPQYSLTPVPSSKSGSSPFGSGRNEAQRKAMVLAINAELELKPYILPKKEDAPSKSDILKIAGTQNKAAQQNFGPDDLKDYSRIVTWKPNFDGANTDPGKAKALSFTVSTLTNYYNMPKFVIALASAVFALDPQSPANANNFASAIITTGEHLNHSITKSEALASYRKDAETVFLYAMSVSSTNGAWTDKSLTAIINLGNLYIDMGKLEEARSLFQVARKLSPFSWDAALGLAAYFHAIKQPDKALAIMEDDNLDRPEKYLQIAKAKKSLEKSDKFTDLPLEAPAEAFDEGIKVMSSEPIETAADFISQIDQSERNKMRYFIEHLVPIGSYRAPNINRISPFASLKAISSAQGICALEDFSESLSLLSVSNAAATINPVLDMLSKMGLKIDPGVDLNDMAKHPEKYENRTDNSDSKVEGMDKFLGNLDKLQNQAQGAELDLAKGNTASTFALAGQIDPFFIIMQIDPNKYADPMNVIIQKLNFGVYNRKTNLYRGLLYSVNKRTHRAVTEIIELAKKKNHAISEMMDAEMDIFNKQMSSAMDEALKNEKVFPKVEWDIKRHHIHEKYFVQFNNVSEVAFNSATNMACVSYNQKIKPNVEAYYYDVLRHIALISDPDVRLKKEKELKSSMNSAIVWGLYNCLAAYSAFTYNDDWDCNCNMDALLEQRDAEQAAHDGEENARIRRNRSEKARFDSGEIPESSPLFKKLDSYGTDFNYVFIKGRISCARTTVNLNVTLPMEGTPELSGSMTRSEFTGAATYTGGLKVGVETEEAGAKVGAFVNLSGSVSVDGKGVVKDYEVTAGTGLSVEANGTKVTVNGSLTFGPDGLKDSDFSAGISRDFSNTAGKANLLGGSANSAFEASTKRGCTMSGKVEQSLEPYNSSFSEVKEAELGKDLAKMLPTDELFKKQTWGGTYTLK